MIKSELIQRIARRNGSLYQRDVETIVTTILDEITAALSRGDRVELRGFGAFSVKRGKHAQAVIRAQESKSPLMKRACLFQNRQGNARTPQ